MKAKQSVRDEQWVGVHFSVFSLFLPGLVKPSRTKQACLGTWKNDHVLSTEWITEIILVSLFIMLRLWW